MTPPRRRERQTEVRNPSFHLLLWPRQDNRNARRSGYFIQTAACISGRKLASPNNRHLSLYPLPPLTPSPVHSAGSFNEEISRGKYHSSSDLHFGTTARAGRRVSYQVPADVSRVRQRGSLAADVRLERIRGLSKQMERRGKGRRKKRFRFQVSSLSLMNHHQTERHNNNAIGGSLRFTRVCGSPEDHYDTPVSSKNAAKIHLFMEKKGRWLK